MPLACLLLAFVPVDLDDPPEASPYPAQIHLDGNRVYISRQVVKTVFKTTRKSVIEDGRATIIEMSEPVKGVVVFEKEQANFEDLQVLLDGRPVTYRQLQRLLKDNTPAVSMAVFVRQLLKTVKPGTVVLIGSSRPKTD